MQEEVENRTVNLAISTTKLTGRTIIAGIRKYLQHREKVKMKRLIFLFRKIPYLSLQKFQKKKIYLKKIHNIIWRN